LGDRFAVSLADGGGERKRSEEGGTSVEYVIGNQPFLSPPLSTLPSHLFHSSSLSCRRLDVIAAALSSLPSFWDSHQGTVSVVLKCLTGIRTGSTQEQSGNQGFGIETEQERSLIRWVLGWAVLGWDRGVWTVNLCDREITHRGRERAAVVGEGCVDSG
jgi:hypothetical protein